MTPEEARLRTELGIPHDVKRVLVFGESSHWDTNWLQTSEQYFQRRIEPIFAAVMGALERDGGRTYCVESLFFLKLYWERRPDQRQRLRTLFERRQLRLLSSAYTTPDTLLPHPEAILRDYQLGNDWLLANGLPAAPGVGYFPDNFGHSPHLPSLMQAVGVRAAGLTRIDGMYFIVCDYRPRRDFPLPGSTAELLQKELRSHDFVWRDDSGAELLCHWNAHTYFQGDMIAHAGIIRWDGKEFALPWRSSGHVARRIAGYVQQLAPCARTPYLFCPIGMDFNDPIVDLRPLLTRYNAEYSERTGTYAVLAGLDDYLALIDCHRAALPVLAADPNPYWMGFLATRPEVKQRSVRIARTLLLAERVSATKPADAALEQALHEGWSTLVLTNHHDCITGTSPDQVWTGEQRPWLDAAESSAQRALALAAHEATNGVAYPVDLAVTEDGPLVHVKGPHYALTLSKSRGGCLTSFVSEGRECLRGLGFDLIAFRDAGGLWRLGHEYRGGSFRERARASDGPAALEIVKDARGLVLRITTTLCAMKFVREIVCRADQPFVRLSVRGVAARRFTVTTCFQVAFDPRTIEMDTIGGVIQRPRERLYSPTFWAVPSRLCLSDRGELHALFETPTAASFNAAGELSWIVARNAPKERAFGFLPVLAHPIGGTNDDLQTHEAALLAGPAAFVRALPELERCWKSSALETSALEAAARMVECDAPGVKVAALKRSARGDGVVLRLVCEQIPEQPVRVRVADFTPRVAFVCDALEQPREQLKVEEKSYVTLRLSRRMTSLSLLR